MALGTVDPGRRATTALQEAVRQLPSTIARLAYLSALRDPNSGVYAHPVSSRGAGRLEIDRLLRAMHEEAFSEWLKYSLEKQKADLDLYFSSLDCSKATALETWLRTESYHSLVPASASSVERPLFFSDLEALLRLMANGLGLAIGLPEEAEQGAPDKPLLTVKEVSRWLGVSCRALRLWAECNEIPATKAGRQWRFSTLEIREWLGRRRMPK